jgi:hypothetical protein
MQKLLSSNTQGCQTDLNFSDMFQRELRVEQRNDEVDLKAFKLMER